MTKVINEALDEIGQGIEDEKMDPHTLSQLQGWAYKVSRAMQAAPVDFIQKLETRLNGYGYTILTQKNEIGTKETFPSKGKWMLDIYKVAGKQIVENVFISIEFEKASANTRIGDRYFGSKNFYSYVVEFVEE